MVDLNILLYGACFRITELSNERMTLRIETLQNTSELDKLDSRPSAITFTNPSIPEFEISEYLLDRSINITKPMYTTSYRKHETSNRIYTVEFDGILLSPEAWIGITIKYDAHSIVY